MYTSPADTAGSKNKTNGIMKQEKFTSLKSAAEYQQEHYPENHQEQIIHAFEYNKRDAQYSFDKTSRGSDEWFIINGNIYYITKCDIRILNKLELLGACLHDGPFYRISPWTPEGQIELDQDNEGEEIAVMKFRRDMEARKKYAQWGWTMTTDDSLYWAQIKEWEANLAVEKEVAK